MGFAEEKVKDYIRRNYHRFHDIHLNQLLDFLPCLTPADMQQIRRNTDRHGDILSVSEFFSHLWCRIGWVEQLITALENTNSELAEVIRNVYQQAQARPVSARSPSSTPPSGAHSSNDLPHNQPRPTAQARCGSPPSASLPDMVDWRPPVQESTSRSLEAKTCRNDVKLEVSTPDQCNTNAPDSDASLAVQRTNPANVQPASPNSLVQHQTLLGEVQSSTPSKSDTASSNQPEENSYLSSDSSLLTPRGQDGARADEQIPPLSGCQQELLDKPVNKPFLHLQVNEDQRSAQGQQDSTSVINPAPLLQKEDDRRSQQFNSRRVDFRDAIPTGGVPANLQRRGKSLPPSAPSETTAASCFELDSSEDVSHGHNQCYEATAGSRQVSEGWLAASKGNTGDLETRGPSVRETPQTTASLRQSPSKSSQLPQRLRKEPFGHIPTTSPVGKSQPPPSDFSGSSSMDVIPPSSPTAVSATLSDGHLEGTKPPVRERGPRGADLWTPSKKMTGDVPPRAPSSVTNIPANSSEKRSKASSPSRGAHVFLSDHEEEDVSLLKPGVLASGEITGGPLDQQLNNLDTEYSGTSARFRFSHRSSGGSDPLMVSSSTQGTSSEVSERNMSAGASRAIHHHWNDNHSDGGSIETHTGHIEESPSVDLMGAPEISRLALRNASQPSGDFPDSSAGDQRIRSASPRSVCSDGERNSHLNKRACDKAPSVRSECKLLFVGLALTSLAAVAFVLYKKLKK
ncbi:mitochondrial antiviral-signaling protein isoform X2 [Paroedura picta]|uniref:mitochondrial antiviral-signaling protein isoform X2 n=1 Tax=Paroedura picta TaxID=143630 RepID=UPI0040574263